MNALKIAVVALLGSVPSLAIAESSTELWQQGYKITWESSYEDIEECTPESAIVLSSSKIFVCDGYEYVYHYGAVFIASKTVLHKNRSFTINYLCMEGEDECLSGTLVHR